MNTKALILSLAAVCAVTSLSLGAIAQVPKPHPHPAKAPPPAPPPTAVLNTHLPRSPVAPVLMKKPPVVTAVAPKPVVSGGTSHGIIFVGGKSKTSDHSALNPQPIPPGRPPVDPVR